MNSERTLDRKLAVPALLGDPSDLLIVAGLAGTAKDIAALTGESPNVFLMGGAMGAAVPFAMGLAYAQPNRRVLAVTGDGDLMMSIGILSTIGVMQPPNLAILCVDNGHYGETGYQQGHTSRGVDLEQIAQGSGIAATHTVSTGADFDSARPPTSAISTRSSARRSFAGRCWGRGRLGRFAGFGAGYDVRPHVDT
jgi:phosphonopyruvate decarboxylase